MYSIKEASNILSISEVATYKHIKKEQVKKHIFKKEGKIFITQEGIDLINGLKQNIKKAKSTVKNNEVKSDYKPNEISFLNDTIKLLNKQLELSNEQIKEKDQQINQLLEQNKNNQILLLQSKEKVLFLENKVNKKSWWNIFKRKDIEIN